MKKPRTNFKSRIRQRKRQMLEQSVPEMSSKLSPKKLIKHLPSNKPAELQDTAPRITTETIAAHREEVLSGARKYIYPLPHSKHRIVVISSVLFVTVVVAFFGYCSVALYALQRRSTFLYRATQVIPFPVGRISGRFISYENYLFELRHYTHYYETQQKLDFNGPQGKQQLANYKKQAMDKVINNTLVRQLAAKNQVKVSEQEINDQLTIIRNQNRLGANEQAFRDALHDNFGWSVDDFKRQLGQELLAQKLAAKLDTETPKKAATALAELGSGADFAATAKKYSDDQASKENNGEFGFVIDQNNRDVSPQTAAALFKLQPGQVSGIINTGYQLEILKNIESSSGKIRAAHIVFTFKDINSHLDELKKKQKPQTYVNP